jgi:Domain of unknown function (DUF4440)
MEFSRQPCVCFGGRMRRISAIAGITCLTLSTLAQQPASSPKPSESLPIGSVSDDKASKDMFEAKVRSEWEAIRNKDKKTYGDLLADDYQGVEIDGRGERNKIQSVNDLADQMPFTYTLERLKLLPLGPDAAFVIYEVTMQYPPRAQLRYSRVYIGEVWVKRGGQWKLLHYQETHVK